MTALSLVSGTGCTGLNTAAQVFTVSGNGLPVSATAVVNDLNVWAVGNFDCSFRASDVKVTAKYVSGTPALQSTIALTFDTSGRGNVATSVGLSLCASNDGGATYAVQFPTCCTVSLNAPCVSSPSGLKFVSKACPGPTGGPAVPSTQTVTLSGTQLLLGATTLYRFGAFETSACTGSGSLFSTLAYDGTTGVVSYTTGAVTGASGKFLCVLTQPVGADVGAFAATHQYAWTTATVDFDVPCVANTSASYVLPSSCGSAASPLAQPQLVTLTTAATSPQTPFPSLNTSGLQYGVFTDITCGTGDSSIMLMPRSVSANLLSMTVAVSTQFVSTAPTSLLYVCMKTGNTMFRYIGHTLDARRGCLTTSTISVMAGLCNSGSGNTTVAVTGINLAATAQFKAFPLGACVSGTGALTATAISTVTIAASSVTSTSATLTINTSGHAGRQLTGYSICYAPTVAGPWTDAAVTLLVTGPCVRTAATYITAGMSAQIFVPSVAAGFEATDSFALATKSDCSALMPTVKVTVPTFVSSSSLNFSFDTSAVKTAIGNLTLCAVVSASGNTRQAVPGATFTIGLCFCASSVSQRQCVI